jgi:hypothetical protein
LTITNQRLKKVVADLNITLSSLTQEAETLKERLRISEVNNSKINELKVEIDKSAEYLV